MGRWVPWVLLAAALGAGALWFLGSAGEPAGGGAGEAAPEDAGGDPRAPRLEGVGGEASVAAAPVGTYAVRGRVLGEGQKPLAGVRVGLRPVAGVTWDSDDPSTWGPLPDEAFRKRLADLDAATPTTPPFAAAVESGEDGTFRLPCDRPGVYSVTAIVAPPLAASAPSASVGLRTPTPEVTVHVREGTTLRGRVVDAADRGVRAALRATANLEGLGSWGLDPVATEEDGAFAIPAMPAGSWRLEVRVPGRLTLRVPVDLPRSEPLVIRIGDRGGTVQGAVTDPQGKGVAGAHVLVGVSDGTVTASVRGTSGPDGAYRIEGVPPGRVTDASALAEGFAVHVSRPPLARWSGAEVGPGAPARVDIALERGATVEGLVLEAGSQAPVAGATVFVAVTQATGEFRRPLVARSGPDGSYRIAGVPPGKSLLLARAPRHYMKILDRVRAGDDMMVMGPEGPPPTPGPPPEMVLLVGPEGGAIRRDVVLVPGLVVSGKVVGPDGAPVEGASIGARGFGFQQVGWQWGVSIPGGEESLGRSDADGTFEAGPLPPREETVLYARKAPHVGKPCDPFSLASGTPPAPVTLRLDAGAVLAGKVLDADGEPVSGANVNVWGNWTQGVAANTWTTTGPEGEFRLEGLPAGECTLWVNGARLLGRQLPVEALAPGEVREGVEVRLEAGARVAGTVVDAAGKPLAGRVVSAFSTSGGYASNASTTTKEDGTFELLNAPKGRVQVQVQPAIDGGRVWYGGPGTPGSATTTVEAPADGVRLVVADGTTRVLEGTVLTPSGAPVPLCTVRVSGPSSGGGSGPVYFPGGDDGSECANGRFRRAVQGDGPWTVRVTSPRDDQGRPLNLRDASVPVRSVDPLVEVRLEEGLEVRGHVLGAGRRGVADVFVAAGTSSVHTEEDGSFRLGGLPEGEVTVSVRPPRGYVVPKPVRARAGDRDLTFTLVPGLPVAGEVLDAEGRPVSNGYVQVSWKASGEAEAGNRGAQLQDGRFRCEGIPADVTLTLQVQTWNANGGSASPPVTLQDVRPGTTDVRVRLEAGARISGVVVDADGKPFLGAFLNVVSESEPASNSWSQVQGDGTFVVEGLRPGPHKIHVNRQDGGPAPEAQRVVAPAAGLRIVVPRGETIGGRLVGTGDLSGFRVMARPAESRGGRAVSASVSSDGSFVLEGVGDGPQTLTATRQGDDRYGLVTGVRPGSRDASVELRQGLSISGRVEREGATVGFAHVSASSDGWSSSTQVDAEGGFVLRGLPPGRYRLAASDREGNMARTDDAVDAGATGVRLVLRPRPAPR